MIFLFIDVLFLSIDVCFEWGGTVFRTAACHAVISPETSSRVTLATLGKALFLWIDAKLASAIQLVVETVFFQ